MRSGGKRRLPAFVDGPSMGYGLDPGRGPPLSRDHRRFHSVASLRSNLRPLECHDPVFCVRIGKTYIALKRVCAFVELVTTVSPRFVP